MDPLELTMDLLATYRLTRLATADVIAEPARRSFIERLGRSAGQDLGPPEESSLAMVDSMKDPPKLARLITCRWCAGVWIAGGVVVARRLAPQLWDPVAKALALSAGAGLLAGLEDG